MIEEFLDVQFVLEEHNGFPAFADELVREGVVRTGEKLLVYASRVAVAQAQTEGARFEPFPFLLFLVCGEDRMDSFMVDIELALRALGRRPAAMDRELLAVPAYVAEEPAGDTLRAGAELCLTMSVVELDRPSPTAGSKAGIRFEIAKPDRPPLYSFTMESLTALLAIAVPVLGELPPPHPGSFAEERDRFIEEFEAELDAIEKRGGKKG